MEGFYSVKEVCRLLHVARETIRRWEINPLDIAQSNLAQSVDLLEYLFSSLLEFKMTAMQTTL
jgi:hypothetical protein